MDKVVHFEIPVDDAARAREFYGSAFEWELDEADMGGGNMYTTVTTTADRRGTRLPTEPGAINGGLMQRTSDTPAPVITIGVTSIDESLKKVDAGGGSTDPAAHRDPGAGRLRVLQGLRGQRGRAVGDPHLIATS